MISKGDLILNDDYGAISRLSDLEKKLLDYDVFKQHSKRINSVLIELNDLSDDLSSLNDNLSYDSDHLSELNSRLDTLNNLLNKYRQIDENGLVKFLSELKQKLNFSKSYDNLLAEVNSKINIQTNILKESNKLNQKRSSSIASLKKMSKIIFIV